MDPRVLIGEVAKRHHMVLSEDDPVLVTVTLNELLMEEHLRRVALAIEQGQQQMAASRAQDVEEAKHAVAQLVAAAGEWLGAQVKTAGAAVREELERLVREARTEKAAAREERAAAEKAASAAALHRRRAKWAALAGVLLLGLGVAVAVAGHVHVAGPELTRRTAQ